MVGRAFGVLLVVGSGLGLAACGGKATAGGFQGGAGSGGGNAPPIPPPGTFQTPPPTYDTPPPTYDTPPPDYDSPTGAGSEACTQLCNLFANRTCGGQVITAEMLAQCPAECRVQITEMEPCGAQYGALLSCIMRTQFFQDLIDAACNGEDLDLSEEDARELVAACQSQAEAFVACSGGMVDEPDPPQDDCTMEGGCVGCIDTCAQCECSLGVGALECDTICNPPT